MSPEKYADIARKYRGKPELVAQAMVEALGLSGDAEAMVATHVLQVALITLAAVPSFEEQVDRAVMWATAESVMLEEQLRRDVAHNAETAARVRSQQLERDLGQHTIARLVSLASMHESRKLYSTSGTRLGAEVTPSEAWRTYLSRERVELAGAIAKADRRSRLASQINGINLRGRYDAVHSELRQAAFLFHQSPEFDDLPRPAREALGRLRWEANEPQYRTAVMLTGRWGVGKSRALAEIAAEVASQPGRQVLLRPLPGNGQTLDTAVLNEAQIATGRSYVSLLEFRNDLKSVNARAVILVDDIAEFLPTRFELDRFTQLMLDLTEDDRLRWVLTVDSWHLDRVLSPESTPRWSRIAAFPRHAATVSAWIDLDASASVGAELIQRELRAHPDTTESMMSLLRVPLNAWLYIDVARADTTPPRALAGFDQAYWNEVVNSLTSTREERRACRAVQLVLEQLFFGSLGGPVDVRDVHECITGVSEDAVDEALEVLAESRLIDFASDESVSIASAPLWARGLARHLLPSEAGLLTNRELAELISSISKFDPDTIESLVAVLLLREASVPMQLARLVRKFLSATPAQETGVWVAALTDFNVRAAAFVTLSSAPGRVRSSSPHGAYLLLRLIETGKEELSFTDGLKAVRPDYSTIGENGLQVVLHRFIRHLSGPDVATAPMRRELLMTADGIQEARAGAEFATRWVSASAAATSPESLLAEVENFMREGANYTQQEIEASGAGDAGRPDAAPLVLHLVDALVPDLIHQLGAEHAFDLLAARGWFNEDEWRAGLGGELRRAGHIALGKSYALNAPAVIDLLENLCRGDRWDQESAVFVLRHTAPTFGRRGVHIRKELMPFALRLNESRRLDRAFKTRWVKPMLNPSQS
ncbi:hypothetical protein [Microbacterium sp. MMO-10]|uniref:hypothetical protein n=1 Tax=Microbacterium sp. MMO-10 TaxID=3081272 RepID=UPI00301730EC